LFFLLGVASSQAQHSGATILSEVEGTTAVTVAADTLRKPPTPAALRLALLASPLTTSAAGQVEVPPEHRALFCRFDDALDEKRIPLRMRLGSLEEVNRKEGKPGW